MNVFFWKCPKCPHAGDGGLKRKVSKKTGKHTVHCPCCGAEIKLEAE